MAEQVVVKIQTCTVRQDAPGPEAKKLLGAKELQVQLTCGDLDIETPWKTSGSNFLFKEELALPDNELEFVIFGRGGTQDNAGGPVARALEERDGKLTVCDKDTPDKMSFKGGRKGIKHIELKLVPMDATTPLLGTLVIFLNAPEGSQPPPTASATAPTPATSSGGGGGSAGSGPLPQAVPAAGPQTGGGSGAGAGAGAGGASGGAGGAGMEGWEAAAQAADEAADEAQHEQSLPELRDLFAELHKLRSDLKKEQRVKEHREQECAEAEKALDDANPSNPNPNPDPDPNPNPNPIPIPIPNPSPNRNPNPNPEQALDDAREQVKEQAASLELCEKRRQNAGPEERRRL